MKNKIELLSPAGNMEKMKTALAFGSDAVYAGIPDFSLRVRINDFDMEKLKEATEYCHKRCKKIYITVNIFAHNDHLEKLPGYIKELKKMKVDALIISDPGIIQLVREVWPECEIHLSTQANCTNWQSAKFWFEQGGVKRIILGREVTLKEIKKIHDKVPEVELEYFVHGAMCMSYSGRCFLSKYFVDKSGNLGDCAQPCRWKYGVSYPPEADQPKNNDKLLAEKSNDDRYFITEEKRSNQPMEIVEEEHGSYILNSQDLCLLKHLRELRDAGVVSFKIEGRAKSSYYQAVVAGIYKHLIDNIDTVTNDKINELYNELEEKLVHRGYTTGFLLGDKADQNLDNARVMSNWEFCGQVMSLKSIKSKVKSQKSLVLVKVHNSLKVGDEIEIIKPLHKVVKIKLDKIIDLPSEDEVQEAHGGQEKKVIIESRENIPKFSVIRRKLKI